ncbi:ImmA/IrrE family metallo-endopeptidase [Microbacterium sp. ZW T5_45]|uniref:ImmA/IrrE family metallo-endopeptidase n=1 Tax=Microbacterium sp. ZW T5_45 TaxID=3378080 RepID=UPI003853F3F8
MNDTRLKRIYDMIDALGVRIEYCELPEDIDGEYIHDEKLIRIQFDLSTRVYRSTLAHECCHAVFGDVTSMFGPMNAKQERRADEWAALRMIGLDDYRAQETRHDGNVEAMAIALNVTADMVEVFRGLLLRTPDAVYVDPRMGAGQFAHRIEVA